MEGEVRKKVIPDIKNEGPYFFFTFPPNMFSEHNNIFKRKMMYITSEQTSRLLLSVSIMYPLLPFWTSREVATVKKKKAQGV